MQFGRNHWIVARHAAIRVDAGQDSASRIDNLGLSRRLGAPMGRICRQFESNKFQ
jgi:hypothetical protein